MPSIHVDINEVERVAKLLKEYSQDINDMQNKLNGIGNDVESAWQSAYTVSYIDSLKDSESKLRKLSDNVDTIAQTLKSIAQDLRRLEEIQRKAMDSIK